MGSNSRGRTGGVSCHSASMYYYFVMMVDAWAQSSRRDEIAELADMRAGGIEARWMVKS